MKKVIILERDDLAASQLLMTIRHLFPECEVEIVRREPCSSAPVSVNRGGRDQGPRGKTGESRTG